MWRLLRSTYNRMYSCLCHDGLMSQWFKLNQSVRQGGVLSAWLYLVYINDLATELKKAELGATIHTFYMGTLMQAYDVALLALSVNDMQKMLNICFKYSSRWRYGLNPRKSVVLVFDESLRQNKTRQTMVDRRQPDTRKLHTQACRCAVINLQNFIFNSNLRSLQKT